MKVSVPSTSGEGSWDVRRHADGLSCECPRFDHSPMPKACRHTDIVERAERMQARCREVHGQAEGLCFACLVQLLAIAVRRQRERAKEEFNAGKARGKEIVMKRRRKKGAAP